MPIDIDSQNENIKTTSCEANGYSYENLISGSKYSFNAKNNMISIINRQNKLGKQI